MKEEDNTYYSYSLLTTREDPLSNAKRNEYSRLIIGHSVRTDIFIRVCISSSYDRLFMKARRM